MKKLLSILFVFLLATSSFAAPPADHDGSGTQSYTLDWSTMVTETNPSSARYRIIDGVTAGDWTTWSSPWNDATFTLPETTENVTIQLEVTDLAGNANNYVTDQLVIPIAAAGVTYLINEDFESGTTPANWPTSSSIAYNSTPALHGNYSFLHYRADGSGASAVLNFTSSADVYISSLISFSALPSGSLTVSNVRGSSSTRSAVTVGSSGTLTITNAGGTSIVLNDFVSIDSPFYLKHRVKAGTGSNAVVTVWTSADGASWTEQGSTSDGTFTANLDNVQFLVGEYVGVKRDRFRVANENFSY